MPIPSIARESEIVRTIIARMLSGTDVFHVKGNEWRGLLGNPAILTASAGTSPHELTCSGVHLSPCVD